MKELERRVISGAVELREQDGKGVIEGYGAVFGQETVIGDWFRERIEPGAFDDAVTKDDVRALFNHDPNLILGRTKAGTLTLSVDERGLKYAIEPPNVSYANDLRESVRRGDVSQSSFAFRVLTETWEKAAKPGELSLRLIQKVELFDVSPVTYPAYEGTSVSARAKAEAATEMPIVDDGAVSRLRSAWGIAEAEG